MLRALIFTIASTHCFFTIRLFKNSPNILLIRNMAVSTRKLWWYFPRIWTEYPLGLHHGKFRFLPYLTSDHIGISFTTVSKDGFRSARSFGKHCVYHMRHRRIKKRLYRQCESKSGTIDASSRQLEVISAAMIWCFFNICRYVKFAPSSALPRPRL